MTTRQRARFALRLIPQNGPRGIGLPPTLRPIILASVSPRRRELLRRARLLFHAWDPGPDPPLPRLRSWSAASLNATVKAARGALAFPGHLALGADTVVVLDQDTLGKPREAEEARRMLRRLSGREHSVYTAFCLAYFPARGRGKTERVRLLWLEVVQSRVRFATLTGRDINEYVASGAPLDKAGAYGIQDSGPRLVESVHGSYYNVVGLPIHKVVQVLKILGAL